MDNHDASCLEEGAELAFADTAVVADQECGHMRYQTHQKHVHGQAVAKYRYIGLGSQVAALSWSVNHGNHQGKTCGQLLVAQTDQHRSKSLQSLFVLVYDETCTRNFKEHCQTDGCGES